MQAVVQIGASQYLVSPGQELAVPQLKSTGTIKLSPVLLVIDDNATTIGAPHVSGVEVEAEVLGVARGEKIRVVKFKAKSRYRKTRGFRSTLTRLKITRIGQPSASASTSSAPAKTTRPRKTRETKA